MRSTTQIGRRYSSLVLSDGEVSSTSCLSVKVPKFSQVLVLSVVGNEGSVPPRAHVVCGCCFPQLVSPGMFHYLAHERAAALGALADL